MRVFYSPHGLLGDNTQLYLGVDGIAGIEYTMPDFPLNFSLDYKPVINLIGGTGIWWGDIAGSIRYTF